MGGLSRAKAPSIEQQTGWRGRMMPVSICQDSDVLAAVSQYDFDLSDEGFCAYAERRGVLYKAGVRGSRRWQAAADHSFTFEQFCAEPSFQFAIEWQGQRYRYSDAEMAGHWRIMRIAKGGLQDCWQLYQAQRAAESVAAGVEDRAAIGTQSLHQLALGAGPVCRVHGASTAEVVEHTAHGAGVTPAGGQRMLDLQAPVDVLDGLFPRAQVGQRGTVEHVVGGECVVGCLDPLVPLHAADNLGQPVDAESGPECLGDGPGKALCERQIATHLFVRFKAGDTFGGRFSAHASRIASATGDRNAQPARGL